jgi:enoyl-CoA hydratase/carnithine racemase
VAISGPEILLVERRPERHYAIVTINREERGNSITAELGQRIEAAWKALARDDDIWAIIFTATGERFFCAGQDIKARAELDATYPGGFEQYRVDQGGMGAQRPWDNGLWKPVIGAINGVALAGGLHLAWACDVRIAAEHAEFGLPEARWNLPVPFVATFQRMVPPALALEMALFAGRRFSAQRMYEAGFVNRVVPKERLLAEAIGWAEEVCETGPGALRAQKELMYRYLYGDEPAVRELSDELFAPVYAMEDTKEGLRAFAERRHPNWKLR